jgi:hypothetical protein
MASLSSAIIFINENITYPQPYVFIGSQPDNPNSYIASRSELTTLQNQLMIDDIMNKYEFDERVRVMPDYPTIVHLRGLRILVILPNLHDPYNREYADVVMYLHQGLADIVENHFGPPGTSFEIQYLGLGQILNAARNDWCEPFGEIPFDDLGSCCTTCSYPFWCDCCHSFSGIKICKDCCGQCKCACDCYIIDNQGLRRSMIEMPNMEAESRNWAFIHRK